MIPPLTRASFPCFQLMCPFSASLSQSTHSLVWIRNLILMASTYSQPIAYSYPHVSIVESGFQFSKSLPSEDALVFGCAARFNLSAMDLLASMNGRGFQALPALASHSYLLARPSSWRTEKSLIPRTTTTPLHQPDPDPPKRVIKVIDLTRDDDGDNEGDDDNHTEVSWLRYTRTAGHRVMLISTLIDRPLPSPDQLPLPLSVISVKLTGTHSRRPHNVIYSGHAWQEEHPRINVLSWFPLRHKLQQRSNTPLDNPSVDALHTGTDSSSSPSTELEPVPSNAALIQARLNLRPPTAHAAHPLLRRLPSLLLMSQSCPLPPIRHTTSSRSDLGFVSSNYRLRPFRVRP